MSVGTICLIRHNGKLLLQKRALGRFGGGKWDCPGGKLQPAESLDECAVREIEEETGLTIGDPKLHGCFQVYFGGVSEPDWIVHVYSATAFVGQLRAGPEGELKWFAEDQLPYEQMWPSDRCWLPDLLEGRFGEKRFAATFWFDGAAEQLLDHSLTVE